LLVYSTQTIYNCQESGNFFCSTSGQAIEVEQLPVWQHVPVLFEK
jgi:hypothetical protein